MNKLRNFATEKHGKTRKNIPCFLCHSVAHSKARKHKRDSLALMLGTLRQHRYNILYEQ
jgi:hypothetical protein